MTPSSPSPITRAILGLADFVAIPETPAEQEDRRAPLPPRCDQTPDLFAAEAPQTPEEAPEIMKGYRPSLKSLRRIQPPAQGQESATREPARPPTTRRRRFRVF